MNQIAKSAPPPSIEQICGVISKMDKQFESALPEGISVERFKRVVNTGIQTHRDRDKLANADRQTLYNACVKAASDGLLLDGREAALVVFAGEVQYMPMVQGLVKLARNSGDILKISAAVVYANDKFSYSEGVDEAPIHEADWFEQKGDRGAPIGAWALVSLENGEKIPAILSKKKIMNIASKSKNAFQYDPEKGPYFDEWWKKTAIKNVLKYAPKSNELEKAMKRDEVDSDQEFVDAETGEVTTAAAPKKTRRRAAEAVKQAATPPAAEPENPPAPEVAADPKVIEGTAEVVKEPAKKAATFRRSDNDTPPQNNHAVEEEVPI